MESDARELMAEVERAEAAPYLHYEPSLWWHAPYFGSYFAGLVLALTYARGVWAYLGCMVVLLGSLYLVVRHFMRRNGALPMPGRGTPPPEIAAIYRRYFWSLLPLGAVLATCWLLLPAWLTAAIAFVAVTAGVVVYNRAYDRAAATARTRLA